MELTDSHKDNHEAVNDRRSEEGDKEGEPCEKVSASETEEQQQQAAMEKTDDDSGDAQNVLDRLGDIDLTEEDTELLLEEAYAMNRQLKEILKQQEKESSSSPGMIRRISNPNAKLPVNSKHSVLPPIKKSQASKQSEIYSARMSRPHQSTVSSDASKAKSATSRKPAAMSAQSGSSSRKSKGQKSASSSSSRHSGGEKPVWNDRFSYN